MYCVFVVSLMCLSMFFVFVLNLLYEFCLKIKGIRFWYFFSKPAPSGKTRYPSWGEDMFRKALNHSPHGTFL